MEAIKIPSIVDASHLVNLREKYCIPYYIELVVLFADERACFPKQGYIAISEFLLKARLRLPLYIFFIAILKLIRIGSDPFHPQCLGPTSGILLFVEGDLLR